MNRSAIGTILGSAALIFAVSATANINLRDPSIWEEKPVSSAETSDNPCEVFSSSVCPAWEDEKADIQRERERREQLRRQRLAERN